MSDIENQQPERREAHILSVQSHVARDYVGNRACSLALQLMGHEVDVVNTVQFSSMYVHQGTVESLEDIESCLQGLETVMASPKGSGRVGATTEHKATCHDFSVLLSGFIGNPKVLVSLCDHVALWRKLPCVAPDGELLAKMMKLHRTPLFVMDPVMGDNGHLYVSQEMVDQYKESVALADVITPNFYELEWLTDHEVVKTVKPTDDLQLTLDRIALVHDKGPKFVWLTSCETTTLPIGKLLSIASVRAQNEEPFSVLCLFSKLDVYLGGCGDVANAMLVDRLLHFASKGGAEDFPSVLEQAVLTTVEAMQICMAESAAAGMASINVVKMAPRLRCASPSLSILHQRNSNGSAAPASPSAKLTSEWRISKISHAASTIIQGNLTPALVIEAAGIMMEHI